MTRNQTLYDIEDRVAVVVGGAGQIGYTFTEILAEKKAIVAVAELSRDGVAERVQEANAKYPSTVVNFDVDITDEASVDGMVTAVIDRFGRVDILINAVHFKGNPADLRPNGPFFKSFENYPLTIWKKALDVNLTGLFLCCQKVAKHAMIPQRSGVMINISSTYGHGSPNPGIYGNSGINSPIPYATTKAAILNFTRYLAVHLAPHNIRVNTLSPGGVRHPNQAEDFVNRYQAITPMGRMAQPDDYQGAILFLASDASAYMTGANISVDGGWTAW
jgi:NAD(P)-dependent dehydrogenase (short-subunit alcohol dehydrogenase family)